jgi:hypothetical protein
MDKRIVVLLVCANLLSGTTAAFGADILRPDQIAAIDAAVRQAIGERNGRWLEARRSGGE